MHINHAHAARSITLPACRIAPRGCAHFPPNSCIFSPSPALPRLQRKLYSFYPRALRLLAPGDAMPPSGNGGGGNRTLQQQLDEVAKQVDKTAHSVQSSTTQRSLISFWKAEPRASLESKWQPWQTNSKLPPAERPSERSPPWREQVGHLIVEFVRSGITEHMSDSPDFENDVPSFTLLYLRFWKARKSLRRKKVKTLYLFCPVSEIQKRRSTSATCSSTPSSPTSWEKTCPAFPPRQTFCGGTTARFYGRAGPTYS